MSDPVGGGEAPVTQLVSTDKTSRMLQGVRMQSQTCRNEEHQASRFTGGVVPECQAQKAIWLHGWDGLQIGAQLHRICLC